MTILLYWDTSRKDLLEPFIALKNDLNFIIVWAEKPDTAHHPFRQIFFNDYSTPYKLLDEIKPDKILFFNINTFPTVAVNLAAKNLGIPTYVMHHGIHHSDNIEINKQIESQGLHTPRKAISNRSTLKFYLSALRLKNIGQVFPMARYAWLRQKRDRILANERCVFDARLPDYYINLSPHNAIIAKKIDHVSDDSKFIYIGHPFFDKILQELNELKSKQVVSNDRYYLLIDFANRDQNLSFRTMTAEGKRKFYQRLSAFAKANGCRLKIKLHPFGYDSPHNYQDDNIDLIRETNVAELIHGSEKCFSFFSTLIIPIVYHKGLCYIFHIGSDRNLQKELVDLGVAVKLTAENFENEMSAAPESVNISNEGYKVFIERFLYYTDGKATERLKNILSSNEAV